MMLKIMTMIAIMVIIIMNNGNGGENDNDNGDNYDNDYDGGNNNKQLLDEVFVICRIINVEVFYHTFSAERTKKRDAIT